MKEATEVGQRFRVVKTDYVAAAKPGDTGVIASVLPHGARDCKMDNPWQGEPGDNFGDMFATMTFWKAGSGIDILELVE